MSRRKQSKFIKSIIGLIVAACIVGGGYLGSEVLQNQENTVTAEKTVNNSIPLEADDQLQIYFFDVGQADSILLISDGETMLIDAGNNEDGDMLVEKIKGLGITTLNYVIGTHPHEDHIGGLDDIIENFEIENVYMPKIQTNTKTFEDVLDALQEKNLSVTAPEVGSTFVVGKASCEVMQCGQGTVEEKNNLNLSSIVIRTTFGEQSFLFMGDSETENEEARTWPQTNVLKVAHHGSDTSSSESFLEQIKPQIAMISVGEGNSYGHPAQVTLNKLSNIDCRVYRTDEMGTILLRSDGIENKITTEK